MVHFFRGDIYYYHKVMVSFYLSIDVTSFLTDGSIDRIIRIPRQVMAADYRLLITFNFSLIHIFPFPWWSLE